MPTADDADAAPRYDALDALRHDLQTRLTIIHLRAHLLARAIRRSRGLGDHERDTMLHGLADINAEVRGLVARIDGIDREAVTNERNDAPRSDPAPDDAP
jgi:hypothetical protein